MDINGIKYISRAILEFMIAAMLATLIFLGRGMGCFSGLQYTNLFSQLEQNNNVEILSRCPTVNITEKYNAYEAPEELFEISQKYINEISVFLKEKYKISRDIPKYSVWVSDTISDIVTVNDSDIGICVIFSSNYIKLDRYILDPLIIHEMFHVINANNGQVLMMYNGKYIACSLAEGYTEILTDEFTEYMGYNLQKRSDNTFYGYYIYLVEMLRIDNEHIINAYYFDRDIGFPILLEKRLKEKTGISTRFEVLPIYEETLEKIVKEDKFNKERFLSTLEITLYYLEKGENNEEYTKYLDYIFEWYESNYQDKITEKEKAYFYNMLV